MPQVWKVSKAFLSTVSKEDKTPQVIKTQGGDMHKFMVQVEGQPIDGWLGILKKPGFEVKQGDELYGDIVENNWGKPQFNRAQRPDGFVGGTAGPAPKAQGVPAGDRLEYLISLVENFLKSQGADVPATKAGDVSVTDIDDKPVDLSQLDY